MSHPERDIFSHPFIPPMEFEQFEPIISEAVTVMFPNADRIEAVFGELTDHFHFFGEKEKAGLAVYAGQELCGVEIAYLLSTFFYDETLELREDLRTLVEDLRAEGVEDRDVLKGEIVRIAIARRRNGLADARLLFPFLVDDPTVLENGNEYLQSIENVLNNNKS